MASFKVFQWLENVKFGSFFYAVDAKQKSSGVTLIYVMLALLIISFIGLGILKLSSYDLRSTGDYSSMKRTSLLTALMIR